MILLKKEATNQPVTLILLWKPKKTTGWRGVKARWTSVSEEICSILFSGECNTQVCSVSKSQHRIVQSYKFKHKYYNKLITSSLHNYSLSTFIDVKKKWYKDEKDINIMNIYEKKHHKCTITRYYNQKIHWHPETHLIQLQFLKFPRKRKSQISP